MTQDIQFTASGKQIEDAINNAVKTSLSSMFSPAQYGRPSSPGYAVIEDRVLEWARTTDLSEYIEKEATKAIEAILPLAVERAIRNRAGVILSGLVRSGALDDQIASVIEDTYGPRR